MKQAEPPVYECSVCGNELAEDAIVCPGCGNDVLEIEEDIPSSPIVTDPLPRGFRYFGGTWVRNLNQNDRVVLIALVAFFLLAGAFKITGFVHDYSLKEAQKRIANANFETDVKLLIEEMQLNPSPITNVSCDLRYAKEMGIKYSLAEPKGGTSRGFRLTELGQKYFIDAVDDKHGSKVIFTFANPATISPPHIENVASRIMKDKTRDFYLFEYDVVVDHISPDPIVKELFLNCGSYVHKPPFQSRYPFQYVDGKYRVSEETVFLRTSQNEMRMVVDH